MKKACFKIINSFWLYVNSKNEQSIVILSFWMHRVKQDSQDEKDTYYLQTGFVCWAKEEEWDREGTQSRLNHSYIISLESPRHFWKY